MTNNHSISPLRQRMLDDMTMRKLNPKTQAAYLRAVKNFTRFFGRSPIRPHLRIFAVFNCRWSNRAFPAPRSMPPLPV